MNHLAAEQNARLEDGLGLGIFALALSILRLFEENY
jgi:hypothetical protein